MPQAVAHILIPLIILALFRDWYNSKKDKRFSLHYILIGGIAGILPDIDVAAFWVLHFFGFTFEQVHKTILHSSFIPLIFFILFFALRNVRLKELGRHKLKLNIIFLMLFVGSLSHLILDSLFGEPFSPFYPLKDSEIGINLVSFLPVPLQGLAMPSLDAALLIIWLIYLELKHKISDFI